jgi:uncharacterized membrane protein YhaH (DUF805 family)
MFKNPFSFEGRIRRTEYCLSYIIYIVAALILNLFLPKIPYLFVMYIPMVWFFLAQGAKRCHDRDNNGFYQIIPLYVFVMMFGEGQVGRNRFGQDPKGYDDEEDEEITQHLI